MNPDKIGKFIYELRKEKNLSQYQLADMIPISRQGVSKWERGKTTPDPQTLLKLSELFNVSINELLVGERLSNNSIEALEETTLSIIDQSNKKIKKIKRVTNIAITTIILLLLSFLSYYFINSYNTTKVYTIYGKSRNFITTDGIMIITKEKMYLKLGKLKNKNNNEIKNLKLYYKTNNKKNIMIEDTDIDNMLIKDNIGYYEKIRENISNNIEKSIYLEITYNENEKEIIKLNFVKDFSNIKLFFTKEQKGETKKVVQDVNQVEVKKEETKPVIEESVEEEKQINPKIVEEPKEEIIEEEIKEEEKEELEITSEQIINKIKEVCIKDLDSYVCEYSDILIFYSEIENQIIIMQNDNILDDYNISLNQHICPTDNCLQEFNTIIINNLFS